MSKEKYLANEQELIKACIQNNPKAQKHLFELHANKMLAICNRYCQNLEDAKDAMHEGFIKIFKQIEKFKGNSKLETWMTRIMIYTAIDHFKKSTKFNFYETDEEIYQVAGIQEEEQQTLEYDDSEIKARDIRNVVKQLPDGYKTIFCMYAIDGLSHKEIAQKLSITEGTSKSQLARARKLLKKLLKEQLNIG